MAEPNPVEKRPPNVGRLLLGYATDADRGLDDVAECRHVGEQVEALEDHPDVLALAGDVLLAVLDELAVDLAVADEVAVHLDPAALNLLEVVDAADERRLAGTRRADHDDDLGPLDGKGNPLEDLALAEPFLDVGRLDHEVAGWARNAADGGKDVVRDLDHQRVNPPPPTRGLPSPRSRAQRLGAPSDRVALAPRRRSMTPWISVQIVVSAR